LGHKVGQSHWQRDHVVDIGGQGDGGIQVGSTHTAETLDADQHYEPKVYGALEVGVGEHGILDASHATQEHQHGGGYHFGKNY